MKTIHLDAVGGIAGDMFVAAMLDAFPELKERVLADGAAVLPPEAGNIRLAEGESGGIAVLRFGLTAESPTAQAHETIAHGVTPTPNPSPQGGGESGDASADSQSSTALLDIAAAGSPSPLWEGARGGGAAHAHKHAHHDHAHTDHDHSHDHHPHAHDHHVGDGGFRDMVARIEAAPLHPGTATHAIAILTIIAEAEAAIHKVPLANVHFHELADWDSLLDVTCAGSIAAALEGSTWSVSDLPRGGGLVRTAHGLLPVPAPATAAILKGFDWRDDGIAGERVTPTGAAILKHLVDPGKPQAAGRLAALGTGAGTKKLPGMPNVLRALVFEHAERLCSDRVAVIEFEVDDMTGEEIGVATDRLRGIAGVLDVSISQRYGKKGRPMSAFHLLARPDVSDSVAERCFAETSTIGLRLREEPRLVLPRESMMVAGVSIKTVARPGGRTAKAESDALMGDSLAERRAQKRQAEAGDG
ncbi:LarC family nickel insertion protein [Mesorhizobium sp. CN2-181]|uniref:LarC family nickel insertion protein n=1 Tax=Mesorhizobium yinganensis TaxID=3157707 RepID=UPI0032B7C19E